MRDEMKIKLAAAVFAFLITGGASYAAVPADDLYAVPAPLQAKIDSHPHTRRLTDWGSRPDWSADSERILFLSREYGDIFELDFKTGRTRPLSFHFSHVGIFRAYYLQNGDILYTAPREHVAGMDRYSRFYESELWLLKAGGTAVPIRLGEPNFEGVAVSRDSMRIVWAKGTIEPPAREPSAEAALKLPGLNQLWAGNVAADGASPAIADKRMVLDCKAPTGAFKRLLEANGSKCFGFEPQNFVPGKPDQVTFTMVSFDDRAAVKMGGYLLDLSNGNVTALRAGREYMEVEGIFADGRSTLVEHIPGDQTNLTEAAEKVELWQLALDGSGTLRRVAHYGELDPELKSNQGVVSPDGRWLAYSVSTAAIERRVQGQGIGIFLMDLKAAGF